MSECFSRSRHWHLASLGDSLAFDTFIGGSDARIIMGDDESALVRLWRERRGEIEPENLSGNPVIQLRLAERG